MRTTRTLLIGTAIAALLATGCEWNFETLDGNGVTNGRTTNNVGHGSAVLTYNGRPHVFYHDVAGLDLRHGYYNGQFWAFETLDGHQNGPNGRISRAVADENAAILYNGRPHVFYPNINDGDLRHAYYNGQFWAFETLDGNGGPNGRTTNGVGDHPAVVLYNGRPHVFYEQSQGGDLRHAYWNGLFWAFETLDGAGGANGRIDASLGEHNAAVPYNGRPHVFYQDVANGNLRHAYWNGLFWSFETLDGDGGPNGRTTNSVGAFGAVLLYNGRPHVFYWDDTNQNLRHAYYTGSAWGFETLDGHQNGPDGRLDADIGAHNAAVLFHGRPHVFYGDDTNEDLRHAYYTGSAWGFETLDGAGGANGRITNNTGSHMAALLYNGRPDVFYYDSTGGDLRHAYFG